MEEEMVTTGKKNTVIERRYMSVAEATKGCAGPNLCWILMYYKSQPGKIYILYIIYIYLIIEDCKFVMVNPKPSNTQCNVAC